MLLCLYSTLSGYSAERLTLGCTYHSTPSVPPSPIQLVGNYHYRPDESVVSLRLRGGPELFIPTSEYAAGGIMLTYGAQEWYPGKRLNVGLGFTGRWIPQAHVGFWESSVHQATITVRGRFGGIHPGVLVRLPVDDSYRKRVSVVVGASVTVPLLSSSES